MTLKKCCIVSKWFIFTPENLGDFNYVDFLDMSEGCYEVVIRKDNYCDLLLNIQLIYDIL